MTNPLRTLLAASGLMLLAAGAARADMGEPPIVSGTTAASPSATFVTPTERPGSVFVPNMNAGPGPLARPSSPGATFVVPTVPPGDVFIPMMDAGAGPTARAASPSAPH